MFGYLYRAPPRRAREKTVTKITLFLPFLISYWGPLLSPPFPPHGIEPRKGHDYIFTLFAPFPILIYLRLLAYLFVRCKTFIVEVNKKIFMKIVSSIKIEFKSMIYKMIQRGRQLFLFVSSYGGFDAYPTFFWNEKLPPYALDLSEYVMSIQSSATEMSTPTDTLPLPFASVS